MFEPNYAKKESFKHRDTKNNNSHTFDPPNQQTDKPQFLQMSDIQAIDRSKIITVKTGIKMLDAKIGGVNKGELSVWSGSNASGKSTILSQIALDSVQAGFNVALFSGELTPNRVKNWLYLQVAGRQYTKGFGTNDAYYTPSEYVTLIDSWLDGKFWLYNNDYGMEINNMISSFDNHIAQNKTDVVLIDNLMVLDLSQSSGNDKFERQTSLVKTLSMMAKRHNIHIHFVCHPRKPTGFLRKDDISGTADISNIADNVFICHRVGRDFEVNAKTFYGKKLEMYLENKYTNIIEVCKNRDLGVLDHLAGAYFEVESKRILNERFENKYYNWQDRLQEQWETVENIEGVF